METVLVVLTTSRSSQRAVDYAVERAARQGARLLALFLVESEIAKGIFDTFSDIGFIGERPSAELTEAVMREYRLRGRERLAAVGEAARKRGVPFEARMEEGDFLPTVLRVIEESGAATAVVARRKLKTLRRYFSASLSEELREKAPCEVVIFDE
ncbi:MAG TPA: universal stress protein [Deltaproteobacteria bacterium]|nr:universal stress protein [Deltaproteobacteria bacterium]